MRPVLLLLLVLAGCAAPHVNVGFLPKSSLVFDAKAYPHDAAVVLHRADRTDLVIDNSDQWMDETRHVAVAILGEGGFDEGQLRIPWLTRQHIVAFKARIIQPNGATLEFDQSQLMLDLGGRGERDINASFFRFPNVQVGSVLEYIYVVHTDGLNGSDEVDDLGKWPIRRYEFELTGAKPLVFATIEMSGLTQITTHSLNDGRHQLLFTLENLPAQPKEEFEPDHSFHGPHWAWRILAFNGRGGSNDWLRDWNNVLERYASYLVDSELTSGFSLGADVSGCSELKCRLERIATALAKSNTEKITWDRHQPLSNALSSGRMSSVERAMAMHHALDAMGVKSQLAYGTGHLSKQVSAEFPRYRQFDHLFVVVPPQQGNPRRMVIDPSCDACAPGELPESFVGTRAYTFEMTKVLDRITVNGEWITLPDTAVRRTATFKHAVDIAASGTVHDAFTARYGGEWATRELRLKENDPKAIKKQERTWVSRSSTVGTLQSAQWGACDAKSCTREVNVELPTEARFEDGRWLVPMSFMRRSWEEAFDRPTRVHDVHFADGERIEEVAEVHAPVGFELSELPQPQMATVGDLRIETRVEKTLSGATVRRVFDCPVGVVRRREFDTLRSAVEVFGDARRQVLVFAKKKDAQ